jgi:alpha-beta hydrolase superfamily lysophospholipase
VLAGFSATTLENGVLVRLDDNPLRPRAAVVHVHGYNDYFFQTPLARDFADAGIAFYAVDLNGAGRAIDRHPVPHFMSDISQPGDGIDEAVTLVGHLHPGLPLLLHAHSTGGLSACVWAADRAHPALAGMILDSPLFGRRERGIKHYGRGLLPVMGRARPHLLVSSKPSVYAHHLHSEGGGRWDFNREWKRPEGVPARAAWALAVRRAQQRISRGLGLTVPVLVARSAQTGPERADNPHLDAQDIVVDVEAISQLAPRLGSDIEQLVVEGGIHELSLSAPDARAAYIRGVMTWIDRVLT